MLAHARLAVLALVGLIALVPLLTQAEWFEHKTPLQPLVLPVPGKPLKITNPATGMPYQCRQEHATPNLFRHNITEWECQHAGRLRAITLSGIQDLPNLVTHTGIELLAKDLRTDPPLTASYTTQRVAWTSYSDTDTSPTDLSIAPKIVAIKGSGENGSNSALVIVDLQDHESFGGPSALQSARDQVLADSGQSPSEIKPTR